MKGAIAPFSFMKYTLNQGITIRDFNPYREQLGDDFVAQIVSCWKSFSLTYPSKSETTYFYSVKRLFEFLSDAPQCNDLRKFLRSQISVSPETEYLLWQRALMTYRELIDQLQIEPVSKNNETVGLRMFICDFCANEGVVPHDLCIPGFKHALKLGTGTTVLDERTIRVLSQSEESFLILLAQLDDDDVALDDDLIELLKDLAKDIPEKASIIDRVEVATRLLDSRISALKSTAKNIYYEYINATELGKKWVNTPEYISKALELDRLFSDPTFGEAKDRSLGYANILDGCALEVLIVWTWLFYEGRHIKDSDPKYKMFKIRLNNYGLTRHDIELHSGASRICMVAGYLLVLLETAGNSESIWNLLIDDLVLQDGSEDTYRLNWIKRRSHLSEVKSMQFKVRTDVLSAETLTVKDVFEHQLKCRKKYISDVREADKKKLFLSFHKNNTKIDASGARQSIPTHPSLGFLTGQFRRLCTLASEDRWTSTPKAIRGSRLLLKGILSRDASAVADLGQHKGLEMAARYTYHLPEVLRREQNIRDFLDWFEALLTVDIEGFAKKICLNEGLYSKRSGAARIIRNAELEVAINTQFGGIHCSDPTAGVQPGTKKGEVCTRIDKCPTCVQRRGLFVLSQANLVNVMHWHDRLDEAKASFSEQAFRPWVIWHMFTSMVLEQFSRAPSHAVIFRLAILQQRKEANPYSNIIGIVEVAD